MVIIHSPENKQMLNASHMTTNNMVLLQLLVSQRYIFFVALSSSYFNSVVETMTFVTFMLAQFTMFCRT